jgi:hypothetical protein
MGGRNGAELVAEIERNMQPGNNSLAWIPLCPIGFNQGPILVPLAIFNPRCFPQVHAMIMALATSKSMG